MCSGSTHMPWTSEVLTKNVFFPLPTCLLSQVWAEGAQTMREGTPWGHVLSQHWYFNCSGCVQTSACSTFLNTAKARRKAHSNVYINAHLETALSPSPPQAHQILFTALSLPAQTGSQEPSTAVGASLIPSFHISSLCISAPLLCIPLCRLLEAVGWDKFCYCLFSFESLGLIFLFHTPLASGHIKIWRTAVCIMPSHGCAGAPVHQLIRCTTTEPSWLPCFHRARGFQGTHRHSHTSSQWPGGCQHADWTGTAQSLPQALLLLYVYSNSKDTPALCLVDLTARSGLTFKVYIYIFRWPESKAEIFAFFWCTPANP